MAVKNAPAAPASKSNVKAAPAAAPKAGADAAGVKVKKTRTEYNGTAPKDDKGLLTAVPTDWKTGAFKPLTRKSFASEDLFWDFKALLAEKLAVEYKRRGEVIRKGGGKDAAKAKKLVAMQKKMAELRAALEADGVDVAGILASMEAPKAEATTAE